MLLLLISTVLIITLAMLLQIILTETVIVITATRASHTFSYRGPTPQTKKQPPTKKPKP